MSTKSRILRIEFWEPTLLALIGMVVTACKILMKDKPPPIRPLICRVLMGGAIGISAGAFLVKFPDLPPMALFGIASALSILGLEVFERIATVYFDRSNKKY